MKIPENRRKSKEIVANQRIPSHVARGIPLRNVWISLKSINSKGYPSGLHRNPMDFITFCKGYRLQNVQISVKSNEILRGTPWDFIDFQRIPTHFSRGIPLQKVQISLNFNEIIRGILRISSKSNGFWRKSKKSGTSVNANNLQKGDSVEIPGDHTRTSEIIRIYRKSDKVSGNQRMSEKSSEIIGNRHNHTKS